MDQLMHAARIERRTRNALVGFLVLLAAWDLLRLVQGNAPVRHFADGVICVLAAVALWRWAEAGPTAPSSSPDPSAG